MGEQRQLCWEKRQSDHDKEQSPREAFPKKWKGDPWLRLRTPEAKRQVKGRTRVPLRPPGSLDTGNPDTWVSCCWLAFYRLIYSSEVSGSKTAH